MKGKPSAACKELTAQFYRKNHAAFAVSVAVTLLIAAVNLWITWLLQQMIDAVSGVPGSMALSALVWNVAGVLTAVLTLDAVRYLAKPHFLKKAMTQYKNHAFRRLTQKSMSAFLAEHTATYLSAFSNDAATVETGYLEVQFELLSNAVLLVGALTMMLLYSPVMTVVACAFFLLPIGVSYLTGDRIAQAEKAVSEKNSRLISTLKDCLNGFSIIKSFQAERPIFSLFSSSNADVEQAKCRKRHLVAAIGTLASVAALTAQLGTFLVGALLAQSGRSITPGILMIFINLTGLVLEPIRQLPGLLASRKAAQALIEKLAASLEANIREEGNCIPRQLKTGIAVKNLSFGYEAGCEVLHSIDATFQTGKKYAIVGASGSGKSTLLNLLMASHQHYGGQITYDGHEVKSIASQSLYDMVSMIQQNVFIFNASIRDNITMFREFPKEEVDRAIALSGLSPLIAERGEADLCGENGSGLSGGEKQRIAIARSLLRHSQVLLVDEATAALDAETAYQVSRAILSLEGITGIVVTHALDAALLRQYDGILTLKNGIIAETGTFEELIDKKGYFYSLFTVSQS